MVLASLTGYIIPLSIIAIPLLLLYFHVFVPLQRLAFYKKQGIETTFFPLIGFLKAGIKGLKTTGDYFSWVKASSKTSPTQKAHVVNIGSKAMLLLRDTLYVKEFLQNTGNYQKSSFSDVFRPLLGQGLLFVEGETWKARRKMISSCFHYEFLKDNTPLIQETAREFLDKITPREYKECLIMDKFQEITGEVVGRIFFGRNLNKYTFEGRPLTLALVNIMYDLGLFIKTPGYILLGTKVFSLPFASSSKKLMSRIKGFRAQCTKIVEDRKKEEDEKYNDLLAALLTHQKGSDKLTDEDIVNEFITFFMAGMDTTGHLVAMAVYNLTQHPQYLEKFKEEREKTYNKSKEATTETIQSMNTLTCFLKETMRHHNPVPATLLRECDQDQQILDLTVKKGTIIKVEPFAAYFNDKYYDEPEKFSPERWETPNPKLDPYAFIPFSAGPRNCIGQHLAMIEARIIISEFLERFDFKLSDGYQLKMTFRFLYEPVENLKIDLKRKDGKEFNEETGKFVEVKA